MKNLDQIRASNALAAKDRIEKGPAGGKAQSVVKKVPALIRENGLLATAAFAKDDKQGIQSVIDAVVAHLQHERVQKMPKDETKMTEWLIRENSSTLREVTAEAMAYLNYLRRYVKDQ